MTLDEIVSDYMREYRDDARAEMRFFEIQRSPSVAIARNPMGGRALPLPAANSGAAIHANSFPAYRLSSLRATAIAPGAGRHGHSGGIDSR